MLGFIESFYLIVALWSIPNLFALSLGLEYQALLNTSSNWKLPLLISSYSLIWLRYSGVAVSLLIAIFILSCCSDITKKSEALALYLIPEPRTSVLPSLNAVIVPLAFIELELLLWLPAKITLLLIWLWLVMCDVPSPLEPSPWLPAAIIPCKMLSLSSVPPLIRGVRGRRLF